MRGARARWHASTRSPTAIISRRTRRSSTARSGPARAGPAAGETHGRPRCRSRRAACTSGSGSTSATSSASTSLGRVVEARVSSVRDVQWEDARSGGFMFVFRPGPLDHAPQTWIGILQGARGSRRRADASSAISSRSFPNVSAIDSREILTTVQTAVDNVTLAISIVGAIALLSGVLILVGRRRDDQVPARLRGGHPADARGEHANARRRCSRSSTAASGLLAGAIGAAGAIRAHLGRLAPRARHPVAPRAWPRRDRCRRHDRARRYRRRDGKLRCVAAKSR